MVRNMSKFITTYIGIILFVIILFAGFIMTRNYYKSQVDTGINNIKALQDTVRVFKNKDSLSVSRIRNLETSRVADFTQLELKDKEIVELQQIAKNYKAQLKNTGSVTNFEANTKVKTVVETQVVHDTISTNDIYKADINMKGWITGTIEAKKDSTKLDLQVKNKYSVIIGQDKTGLFTDVINYNEYSEVPKLRTYQVTDQRKKESTFWKYVIAIGLGITGGILIAK